MFFVKSSSFPINKEPGNHFHLMVVCLFPIRASFLFVRLYPAFTAGTFLSPFFHLACLSLSARGHGTVGCSDSSPWQWETDHRLLLVLKGRRRDCELLWLHKEGPQHTESTCESRSVDMCCRDHAFSPCVTFRWAVCSGWVSEQPVAARSNEEPTEPHDDPLNMEPLHCLCLLVYPSNTCHNTHKHTQSAAEVQGEMLKDRWEEVEKRQGV